MKQTYPIISGFHFATGDVNYLDYGGTWVRQISDTAYHFIRLINWEDSVGEREAKEIGYTYNLQLAEVDLAEISDEQLRSALDSCGDSRSPESFDAETQACMSFEYGNYGPLRDENSNNFYKTFREMARYSRELSGNPYVHEGALQRPVNKIGSTAREFMRGDIDSALARALLRNDPNAKILAKMTRR